MELVICGDALEKLKELPAGIVQTCVTSPPYYGLRDYGTASWAGGDASCDHKHFLGGHGTASKMQTNSKGTQQYQYTNVCGKCGAVHVDNQIGLESTPDEFITRLVAVFREVKRVLKDDGTLWVNMGDSYWGSTQGGGDQTKRVGGGNKQLKRQEEENKTVKVAIAEGCKQKDMMGIPWMLAFALRADGWYLRSDIIWAKPNPMPESVTDRPTKSHEHIFLLSKSSRYYYDADAIKENSVGTEYDKTRRPQGRMSGARYLVATGKLAVGKNLGNCPEKRNKRDVWTVTTKPFKGSHFATFPKDLITPCILAGSAVGNIVLDPFGGAGTTALVAKELGRNYITIELNQKYVDEIIQPRIFSVNAPLLLGGCNV